MLKPLILKLMVKICTTSFHKSRLWSNKCFDFFSRMRQLELSAAITEINQVTPDYISVIFLSLLSSGVQIKHECWLKFPSNVSKIKPYMGLD